MNFFIKFNESTFEISKSIADTLKKNYNNFTLETQNKKQTLIFNNSILSSLQVVKTTSQTHFYVLIFNKKHRINKSFYAFLNTRFKKNTLSKKTEMSTLPVSKTSINVFSEPSSR